MVYKSINEIPDEGKGLILDLIKVGAIKSDNGEIELSEETYDTLIILAKLGVI